MPGKPDPTAGLDLREEAKLSYALAREAIDYDERERTEQELRDSAIESLAYSGLSIAESLLYLIGERKVPHIDLEQAIKEALELVQEERAEDRARAERAEASARQAVQDLYGGASVLEPYSVEYPPLNEAQRAYNDAVTEEQPRTSSSASLIAWRALNEAQRAYNDAVTEEQR